MVMGPERIKLWEYSWDDIYVQKTLAVKNKQMKGCEHQKSISQVGCFTRAEGSLGGYICSVVPAWG